MKFPFLPVILSFGTKLAGGLIVILIFWLISLAVRKIILTVSKKCDESKKDVIILLSQIAWITILIFGIITGLGTMGINISALVAGLGLTGFTIGFALKDSLSNILSGVIIVIYKPFKRNDLILVTDSEGTVTEINLRYTTLQADGQKILIPNSVILNNKIIIKEKKNDPIPVTASEGTVTEINLKYKTLQTDGQKILIPDSVTLNNRVIKSEKDTEKE